MQKKAAIHIAKKLIGQVWCRAPKDWIVTYQDLPNVYFCMVGDGRREYFQNIAEFRRMYPEALLFKDYSSLKLPSDEYFRHSNEE